ncbi:isocitrate lyase/PEP mutase family protein [Pseudomonas oryzihabitans]|uniref:isocitrate lyase/PEP mutase family protein n=1 Tax=Pseudomonas oryzihabitans TaxID=47885 RepID=UPI00111CF25C|nr:isocitrate lyase/phosphoenolpyruvate mutase family protein [Pseudomonas psychrotolerans]QDD88498.1 PEP phosphonomutase [Pseudomonas psychrotolerans]
MAALAETFHDLHRQGLLILANVGDAGGARLVERLGSQAVATSSAAMAWTHGYQDGNQLPLELLSASIASMTRVLGVPLTVDIEGGYSDEPVAVAKVIEAVLAAGAVGINIEDGVGAPDLLVRKLETARTVADRHGIDLFVNVRCDVYLKNLLPAEQRLEELLRRAARYADAGADGFFAAGVTEPREIATLCREAKVPVNLLWRAGLAAPDELQRLGVRRLSAGSSIAEYLYGALSGLAQGFLKDGRLDVQALQAHTYGELNALLAPR